MKSSEGRDPRLVEVLARHKGAWVPAFLARAALGCASVVVVSCDGDGSVALVSPAEASAWLKRRGDAKGAAKVAGTAVPGAAWAVGITAAGAVVWALAMGPFLAG